MPSQRPAQRPRPRYRTTDACAPGRRWGAAARRASTFFLCKELRLRSRGNRGCVGERENEDG
eukprot:scaffold270_cov121-Isochrysis_galbana.AAC.7